MQKCALYEHVLAHKYTHTRAEIRGVEGAGGDALVVQQGQETVGLKPITNGWISSHVHTAF